MTTPRKLSCLFCLSVFSCLVPGWSLSARAQDVSRKGALSSVNAVGPHPNDAPVPDDGGQTNVKGAMVRSVLPDGGKHFVSPKKVVSFVRLRAKMPHELEGEFSNYFEWGKPKDPDTGAEIGTAHNYFFDMPRDKPGKYTVEVLTKSTGTVATVDKITVWIVWVTGAAVNSPVATLVPNTAGIRTVDGNLSNGAYLLLDQQWMFEFSILPSSITDSATDVPDLTTGKDTSGNKQIG